MIESGSHTPGVTADMFGLPPHTALRYERPSQTLSKLVLSYAVLDSEPVDPAGFSEWMLPGWAQIWVMITAGPITVDLRNRHYEAMPVAILYGVTSHAMPVTSKGGVTIAIDVSPLGWARLFDRPADVLRDRITPLDELLPKAIVGELVDLVHRSDKALEIKGLLDGFFARHFSVPHPDEPIIAQIMNTIADPDTTDLVEAAASIGLSAKTMRRMTKRYFGFPPKTLTRRVRFLRALELMMREGGADPSFVPVGYHDASHFIRDARAYLGMTARQFVALDTPYLDAALRARQLVFGTPTPALDHNL